MSMTVHNHSNSMIVTQLPTSIDSAPILCPITISDTYDLPGPK